MRGSLPPKRAPRKNAPLCSGYGELACLPVLGHPIGCGAAFALSVFYPYIAAKSNREVQSRACQRVVNRLVAEAAIGQHNRTDMCGQNLAEPLEQ
jgi:hypothetical protein